MSDDVCSICLVQISSKGSTLPCTHSFHTTCIRTWFRRRQSCPYCCAEQGVAFFADIPLNIPTYAQAVRGGHHVSDTEEEYSASSSDDEDEWDNATSAAPPPTGLDVCARLIAYNSHKLLTACPLAWGGGPPIGDYGVVALCRGLPRNKHLNALALAGQEVSRQGASALATALSSQRSVRLLDLSDNDLGDEGAAHVGAMLGRNSRLWVLMLSANGITDSGVAKLCLGLIQNRTLRELHLHGNRLTASGFASLAELMRFNTTLRKLSIDFHRRMPSRRYDALCRAAAGRSPPLELVSCT